MKLSQGIFCSGATIFALESYRLRSKFVVLATREDNPSRDHRTGKEPQSERTVGQEPVTRRITDGLIFRAFDCIVWVKSVAYPLRRFDYCDDGKRAPTLQ